MDELEIRVKKIEIELENSVRPVLKDLSACYRGSYETYRDKAENIENLEVEVGGLKFTVRDHERRLVVAGI